MKKEDHEALLNEIKRGGARGLEVLSLAECKNISDSCLVHIKALRYLSKLVLLGCMNVKDDGIREVAPYMTYLEEFDLGGTNIT